MRLRRIRPAIVLLATLLGFVAGPSAAQDAFPSKPIRLVVPYPAGGTTDIMARLLMEKASASLNSPLKYLSTTPAASASMRTLIEEG